MVDKAASPHDRTQFLGSGSITQLMRRLSLPAVGSMVSIAVYMLIDAAFIGLLGTAELGAASVAFPLFTAVGGVGQVFGTGAASIISRLLGRGDREKANTIASAALLGVLFAGGAIATVVNLTLEPLLARIGGTSSIIAVAGGYTRILIFANAIIMVNVTLVSIIRAEGNIRRGMYSVMIATLLNVVLDPIFMFAFDLGLRGAAIATLIAQSASLVFLTSTFVSNRNTSRIHLGSSLRGLRSLPKLLLVGVPSFLLQLLGASAIAFINVAAAKYGDAAVASVGLTFRVLAVGMYPIYGFTTGFQPVAGYNYGAGNYDRVLVAIRAAVVWTSVFAVLFTAVVVGFAPSIVLAFSRDPAVIMIGARMLRFVTLLFPLFGLQIVAAVLFQALGYALPAALIILARQGIFFYPAIILLPRYFGLNGIILTQPIADLLTTLLTSIFALIIIRRLRANVPA